MCIKGLQGARSTKYSFILYRGNLVHYLRTWPAMSLCAQTQYSVQVLGSESFTGVTQKYVITISKKFFTIEKITCLRVSRLSESLPCDVKKTAAPLLAVCWQSGRRKKNKSSIDEQNQANLIYRHFCKLIMVFYFVAYFNEFSPVIIPRPCSWLKEVAGNDCNVCISCFETTFPLYDRLKDNKINLNIHVIFSVTVSTYIVTWIDQINKISSAFLSCRF